MDRRRLKKANFTRDEYGESLYIDGEKVYAEDGESFYVPFSSVKNSPIASIPVDVSLILCDYVIGGNELYPRSPSILFENSSQLGALAHVDIAIIPESDEMEPEGTSRYFAQALDAARRSLAPMQEDGTIVGLDQHVNDEIAFLNCSVRVYDQSFAEAEEYVGAIEDRVLTSYSPPRLFVCYASEDREFVDRLVEALDRHALHAWYDKREIFVGDSIVSKVNEGLAATDLLIVVMSTHSVKKPWVRRELDSSLMRMLDGKGITLLPLRLHQCDIPELLADIRYADFSESFDLGFEALLASIRHCEAAGRGYS